MLNKKILYVSKLDTGLDKLSIGAFIYVNETNKLIELLDDNGLNNTKTYFDLTTDPLLQDNYKLINTNLRGSPVIDPTTLQGLDPSDFEMRLVKAEPLVGREETIYAFKLGATQGDFEADNKRGWWIEQASTDIIKAIKYNYKYNDIPGIHPIAGYVSCNTTDERKTNMIYINSDNIDGQDLTSMFTGLDKGKSLTIVKDNIAKNIKYVYNVTGQPTFTLGVFAIPVSFDAVNSSQSADLIVTNADVIIEIGDIYVEQLRLAPIANQLELENLNPSDFMTVKRLDNDTVWTFKETNTLPPSGTIGANNGTGYWFTTDKPRVVNPLYIFNTVVGTTTMIGDVVLDNVLVSATTMLFINKLAKNGNDYSKRLATLSLGDTLTLVDDVARTDKYTFNIIGPTVLNGDSYEIPVNLDVIKSSPDGTITDQVMIEINLGDIFIPEIALRLAPVISFAKMQEIEAFDYMICKVDGVSDQGEFIFHLSSDPVPTGSYPDDAGTGFWTSTEVLPVLRILPVADIIELKAVEALDFMITKTLDDDSTWIFRKDINPNIPINCITDDANTGWWVLSNSAVQLRVIPVKDDLELANIKALDFMTTKLLTDGTVWTFTLSATLPIPGGTIADSAATGYWEKIVEKTTLRVAPVKDEAELTAINAKHFMITKREDNAFEYIFEQTGSSFNSSFSSSFGGASTAPVGIPDDAATGHWFLYDAHKIYRIPISGGLIGQNDIDTMHPEPLNGNSMVWVNEVLQQPVLTYTLNGSIVSFTGTVEEDDVIIVAANPK